MQDPTKKETLNEEVTNVNKKNTLALQEHLDILEGWYDDATRHCDTLEDGIQLLDKTRSMFGAALTSFAVSTLRGGGSIQEVTEIVEQYTGATLDAVLRQVEDISKNL